MAEPMATDHIGETLTNPSQALSQNSPARQRKPSGSDAHIARFLADLEAGNLVATEPNPEPEPAPCPICKGAGFYAYDIADKWHPDFGKVVPCECREPALRAKRLEKLFGAADIHELWADRSFASYAALGQGDQRARKRIQEWAESGTGSILLTGPHGRGKTGLAIAALRHRVEATECDALFKKAPDLLAAIRGSYDRETGGPTETEVVSAIRDVTLLAIDDLGAEAVTDWRREQLFRIVDHRHDRMLPTIFTSNLDEQQLHRQIGERVVWRIHEMCWPNLVSMNGANLRDVA